MSHYTTASEEKLERAFDRAFDSIFFGDDDWLDCPCCNGDTEYSPSTLSRHGKFLKIHNDFCQICLSGNLKDVKEYLAEYKVNISYSNDKAFRNACANNIRIAQYLFSIKPDINVSANDDEAFSNACSKNLIIPSWLLSIKPDINVSADNDKAFYNACASGKLSVAKWLLENHSTIDITAGNHRAFKFACFNKNVDVATWLCQLLPYNYSITVGDDGIAWTILENMIFNPVQKSLSEIPELNKTCPICSEHTVEVSTDCNHYYCNSCIKQWFEDNKTCPTCRNKCKQFYHVVKP